MHPPSPPPSIPPLAGLCPLADALRHGLPVDTCVQRLKRFHYAFRRLHGIFLARLTSEPRYEFKTAFSYHAYLCAEHAQSLRQRIGEMREPPLGLDAIPHPALEIFFDEILSAPDSLHLVLGLYQAALPALRQALHRYRQDTHPLADAPSGRLCRFALLELDDLLDFGRQTVAALHPNGFSPTLTAWTQLLQEFLAAAGGLDGTSSPSDRLPTRLHSAKPRPFDGRPQRDERFPDPFNMGVNAEAFLYDDRHSPRAKTLMLYYKRLRELDVPEMMASILAESPSQPWAFQRDLTRQLWDEARHALMGEVGFASLGLDWPQLVRVNFTWSLALNTQLSPHERHAVLYFIEQGLMPKQGKRFEWEIAQRAGDPLATLFQDFDWADEVLHARIGRDWYVKDFSDPAAAIEFGDACWSRVFLNYQSWREAGLTTHANWWPELYRAACRHWQIPPDPFTLAFHTTYESIRPDLKTVSSPA